MTNRRHRSFAILETSKGGADERTLYDDFPAMNTDFPVWTGEHFRLRYLQSGDAAGPFACYHDKEAVCFMNADNCIGGFYVETPGEMQSMADWWLKGNRDCPRLTILHLPEEAPVGTAEVCGNALSVLRQNVGQGDSASCAARRGAEAMRLCGRVLLRGRKGGAGGIIMRSSAPTAAWATADWCAPIAPNGWAVRGAGKAAARKRRTAGPIGAA